MSLEASAKVFSGSIAQKYWRMGNLYRIKNKRKQAVSFEPNYLQREMIESVEKKRKTGEPIRLLYLKPRQIGCTTFWGLWGLDECYWKENQFVAIIAHMRDKAEEIFNEIVRFSYDNLPKDFSFPAYNNSVRQLGFRNIGSQIKVTTDGHGITPNILHLTEVARMRNAEEMIGEALQSVPRNGVVIQESTAAGKGGYFYNLCQEAITNPDSGWQFVFLKWWKHEEYCLPVPTGFTLDEEEKKLMTLYSGDGLTTGNLVFRREKIRELRVNKSVESLGVSAEMLFRQNYPFTKEEAFLTKSLSIFNVERLEEMQRNVKPAIDQTQWGNGWFKAYEGIEAGEQYLVSCDPSYGESNHSDYSVAIVFKRSSRRMIAKLRGRYLPQDLAKYLVKIGKFYNNALIVVERNTGHAVLNELMNHLDYRNIYLHLDYDEHGHPARIAGFPTTSKTRGLILSDMETTIEDKEESFPDGELIEECLNFGIDGGKAQALFGHDDCVMAFAIGNYLLRQPSMLLGSGFSAEKPVGV